ncbi:MAG: hypothetical protein KAH91_04970 [Thermoplasmatales archaeon]|nr:hypothetical protein [Thermoplasmatales archaeon]
MKISRDLILILLLVIIGMFIPFLGSIVITFGLDFTKIDNLMKIGKTFGWFLVIFALELAVVYIYYITTNKIVSKKLEKYKPK